VSVSRAERLAPEAPARWRPAALLPWASKRRPAPAGSLDPVPKRDGRRPDDAAAVEDRELVARLAAGESAALREVHDRYAGLVFGLARRVLGDDAMAEDVTQEVFVSVWQQPERFDPTRGSLRSWLGLLAHRRAVDRVRAEVRRARGEHQLDAAEPRTTDAETEVDAQLARAWLAGRVQEALAQLPAEQRDAVVLAYYGGRTYREVAVELDIPEGTAKSRLRLALAKLDDLLQPLLGQDAPAWI
jgi:RNA polymerase sigma-70 factor (ECF subfamily)